MLYTKYRNGKVETVSGLSLEVCRVLQHATLASPGPRGPSGMPVLGRLNPQEVELVECLASSPAS